MTHAEMCAALDRYQIEIAEIKLRMCDNQPILTPCSTPGCQRLTRCGVCLVCYEREQYRMNHGMSPLEPMSSI